MVLRAEQQVPGDPGPGDLVEGQAGDAQEVAGSVQGTRARSASAAAVMALQLVNKARVRPSAASIRAASSSCIPAS